MDLCAACRRGAGLHQQLDCFAGVTAGELTAGRENDAAGRGVAERRAGGAGGDVALACGGGRTRSAWGDRVEPAVEPRFVGLLRRAGGDVVVVPVAFADGPTVLACVDVRGGAAGVFGNARAGRK